MAEEKLEHAAQAALAERIYGALRAGQGIDPPSDSIDYGFPDAFRVRRYLVDRLIADGARPIGHKIGFTSEAMQKMYGMQGPDFGILLDTMHLAHGTPVPVSHMCDTRVEPELAFVLDRPLTGPGVTLEDALAVTREIRAAVEVIDSRVGAVRAKAVDSIADNAGAGWIVLGETALPPDALDLAEVEISVTVGDETQTGSAGDVMDHPAAPLAWLANRLAELEGLGGSLKCGDVVITGSPVRSVAVSTGSKLAATFGPFGSIGMRFI